MSPNIIAPHERLWKPQYLHMLWIMKAILGTLSSYPYISYQLFILSLVQNVGDTALIWEGYHSHLSTAHSLFSSYGSSFNRLV